LYILQSLEDESLVKLCLVNKYFNTLIRDGKFWRQRIHLKLNRDFEDIDIIRSDMRVNFKKLYISLKEGDLKFDIILKEIEDRLLGHTTSIDFMNSMDKVFKYATGLPKYNSSYLNPLIEKVIKMAKGKEEAKRRFIYMLSNYLWRFPTDKYKNIKTNFMELTK
jgi:hypothetical protein